MIGNLRDSRPLHCSKNEVLKAFRLLVRAKSCPYTHSDLSSITYTLSLSMLLLNCCNHLRAESAHIAFFPVIFFTLPVTFFRRHFYLNYIILSLTIFTDHPLSLPPLILKPLVSVIIPNALLFPPRTLTPYGQHLVPLQLPPHISYILHIIPILSDLSLSSRVIPLILSPAHTPAPL